MSAPDREQEKQKSMTVGLDMLKMSLFFIMIIIIMKKKMLNIVDYSIKFTITLFKSLTLHQLFI